MSYSKRAWEEMMAAQYGDEPLDWPIDDAFFLGDAAEPRELLEGDGASSTEMATQTGLYNAPAPGQPEVGSGSAPAPLTREHYAPSAGEAPPDDSELLAVYRRSAGIVEDET